MSNRHPQVHPGWRVPAGLMILGSLLAWPSVGAAEDANCTLSPQTVNVGGTVNWSASVTGIASSGTYRWTLGGGTPNSSTSPTPTVRYNTAGTFETKLRVDDSRNDDECKTNVTVRASASDTQAPTRPTNLAATAASSTQINLTWTASTDNVAVTGYQVFRCQGAQCTPSTLIGTSTTTSYSNTGLTPNTLYRYRVRADRCGQQREQLLSCGRRQNPVRHDDEPAAHGQRRTGPDGHPRRRPNQHRRDPQRQRFVRSRWHHRQLHLDRYPESGRDGQPHRQPYGRQLHVHPGRHRQQRGRSAADTVNVTVNPAPPVNQPPTASAGPDQTVTLAAGQTSINVTLNGSGSTDPDGTIASYNWTGTPDPAEHGQPHRQPCGRHSHLQPGGHRQQRGRSAADTVNVTVNPARP